MRSDSEVHLLGGEKALLRFLALQKCISLRPCVACSTGWVDVTTAKLPSPIIHFDDGAAFLEHLVGRHQKNAKDRGKLFVRCNHPRYPMGKMGALLQSLHSASEYVI